MAIIMTASTIGAQTDRVVLSHVGTSNDVALYSLTFQAFAPALGISGALAMALWPKLVGPRQGLSPRMIGLLALTFLGIGLVLGVLTILGAPILFNLVSAPPDRSRQSTEAAFFAYLLVYCLQYPIGLAATYRAGLIVQAVGNLVAILVNVPGSVYFASVYGAAGPVLCTAATTFFFVSVPCLVLTRIKPGSRQANLQ
jgi:O-antigen/teichoic acid export membrane protein